MVSGKMQPWKTSRNSFPTSRVPPQPPDSLGNSLINENSDPQALVDTYSLRSSSSILSGKLFIMNPHRVAVWRISPNPLSNIDENSYPRLSCARDKLEINLFCFCRS